VAYVTTELQQKLQRISGSNETAVQHHLAACGRNACRRLALTTGLQGVRPVDRTRVQVGRICATATLVGAAGYGARR